MSDASSRGNAAHDGAPYVGRRGSICCGPFLLWAGIWKRFHMFTTGDPELARSFGTLQKRLPQELRLARIKTVAAANRYLRERFVPDYNARFAVPAAEPGTASSTARPTLAGYPQ